MAKTTVIPAGAVKQTVTEERFLTEAESQKNKFSGMDLFDIMEITTPEEWKAEDYKVYINRGTSRGPYVAKIVSPCDRDHLRDKEEIIFDGKVVQRGIGGGTFHFMFKRGSERLVEGNFELEGPERRIGQGSAAPSSGSSELIDVLREFKLQNGGDKAQTLNEAAFLSALKIQEAAIIKNQMGPSELLAMVKELRAAGGGEARSSEMPPWIQQALAVAVPALTTGLVGLITRGLTPQDGLSMLKQMSELQSVVKTIGGSPETPDLTVEILRSLPSLLGQAGSILDRLNQARAMQIVNRPPQLPAGAPSAGSPPAAAAPAAQAAEPRRNVPTSHVPSFVSADLKSAPQPGTPQFQDFLLDRVAFMVRNGDDGKFVHDWLHVADPGTLKWLREQNLTAQELAALLPQVHAKLAELAALPRYQQFIAEFHAVLMAPPEAE
jgi:hypothetical protein